MFTNNEQAYTKYCCIDASDSCLALLEEKQTNEHR